MVVLADNDIVFKLAALDLLSSFPNVLGVDPSSIHVLDSIPFYPRKNPKVKDNYGTDVVARTLEFVDDLPKIRKDDVPLDTYDQLLDYEGVDVGEALLFAAATQHNLCRVVTGDKRCLRALCASDCDGVLDAVTGCVVCLEQLFLWYVKENFSVVCERVVSTPGVDRVLNDIVFSQDAEISEHSAVQALRSYRDGLRDDTGALLIDA